MKTILIVLLGMLGATAQGAYDTSLLKEGSTWVYAREEFGVEEQGTAGFRIFDEGYSGTTRFTLDSLVKGVDTVRFRVIRSDSLRSNLKLGSPPDSPDYIHIHTVDTLRVLLTAPYFAPSTTLLFLEGQVFTGSDPQRLYKGDTVRFRENITLGCAATLTQNLESVGLIYSVSRYGSCGNTYSQRRWRLLEFAGQSFLPLVAPPVALRTSTMRKPATGARKLVFESGRVHIEKQGRLYNLRGRHMPGASRSALAPGGSQ